MTTPVTFLLGHRFSVDVSLISNRLIYEISLGVSTNLIKDSRYFSTVSKTVSYVTRDASTSRHYGVSNLMGETKRKESENRSGLPDGCIQTLQPV